MVNLTAAARAELLSGVRLFLQQVPNVHSPERHSIYCELTDILTNKLSQTFCSSARPSVEMYTLNIQNLGNEEGGSGADVTAVEDFELEPGHAASIHKTLQKKRGISVVHLCVNPSNAPGTHACLLVFDARNKKQHFFDPYGFRNNWLNMAFANRDVPLVEDFTTATRFEDSWPTENESMQAIIDSNHYNYSGNCALCCMLVGVLCTRFGLGDPKLMANLIVEALAQIDESNGFNVNNHNPVASHMSRLWNWMNDLIDIAEILSLPPLDANSTNTVSMRHRRQISRQKAQDILYHFPPLPNHPNQALRNRRVRLRQRQMAYLNSHPEILVGHFVGAEAVAERVQLKATAEADGLRLMFPSSARCGVVLRSGNVCSRRSCVDQPLCWQHRHLTRNHRRTGLGRMRCAASQRACA